MRRHDDGFTLAEVLLATALTLIVISGAMSTFTTAMRLADTSRIVSDTNHGLQAAMSLMVRDFMQTGQGIPSGGVPLPGGAGAGAVKRPGPPGTGFTFPASWSTLPALATGGGMGPTVLGVQTDLVNLMYADPTLPLNQWPLTAIASNGSSMTVDNRTSIVGADGIKPGDLILFSNALGFAMQMVTRINGSQTVYFDPGDAINLNQPGATAGSITQLQALPGVYPPTTATRINLISYYVDTTTDPTLPRLTRQLNGGARLAIALGVENLQFTYDLVDGVTNPANVETPPAPLSANDIRKANLFLSGRSLDLNPQTHQYMRNSMATDVGLRSLTFVDRYR